MEECSHFCNLLLTTCGQATEFALVKAVAEGQADADILCAELEEYKHIQAEELVQWKEIIRDRAKHKANEYLKSTEELLAQSSIDECCRVLDSIVQAQSHKAEFEFICDHVIRLDLISQDDVVNPSAKHMRVEPHSQTMLQTVAQVRSRSASVSSKLWKHSHSTSPPASSKHVGDTSINVPPSNNMDEDDTTPMALLVVALPPAPWTNAVSTIPSVPEHGLGSSMHAPGNEMVDDSPILEHPPALSPKATDAPKPASNGPAGSEDLMANMMNVMLMALKLNLQPIKATVECLSNIVDGHTPPHNATMAKPPSATTLLYPKCTSRPANSGGPGSLPQGEENDSGWPSEPQPH